MKHKRMIVGFIAAMLISTQCIGCKKADESSMKSEVAMGRYVEENVVMPDAVEHDEEVAYEMLMNPEGKIEIYASPYEGEGTFRYVHNEDGSWEKSIPEWLNQKDAHLLCTTYDSNGDCYAIQGTYDGDNMELHLLKSSDRKSSMEIKIKDFEEPSDYIPLSIVVAEDGSIVTIDQKSINFYKDGENIYTEEIPDYVCAVSENQIMITAPDQSGVELMDMSSHKVIKQFPFDGIKDQPKLLSTDANGNLYLTTQDGVYRINKTGSTWEEVMNGRLCSLCQPSLNLEAMCMGKQNDFYIMYQGANGKRVIKHYEYDASVPANPSTTLTIVSLEKCETVSQAILAFEANHQDLLVDYKVMLSDSELDRKTDYINQLNTELLAGNGPDLIVMDGLPMESYLAKGILADLSASLKPLMDQNLLLPNVVEAVNQEGKIYSIPLKVGITYAYGVNGAVKAADSIESLAEYASTSAEKPLFSAHYVPYSGLADFMYDYYSYEFIKGNVINEEGLRSFLKSLNTIAKQTDAIKDEDNWGFTLNDRYFMETCCSDDFYQNKAELGLTTLIDMISSFTPITIEEKIGGTHSSIHGQFTMNGLIGINAAGKQQDLAMEFLQLLLSEEVQEVALADGFPINREALSEYELKEDDFCFGYETFEATQPKDIGKRKEILSLCESLNAPIVIDTVLKEMVITPSTSYLLGETDLDTTVATIMNQVNTYLEE